MKPFSDEKILSDIKGHYQLQAYGFQHALDAGIEAIAKVQEYKNVIEDIKAEIEEKAHSDSNTIYRDGLLYALYVINKHTKEKKR